MGSQQDGSARTIQYRDFSAGLVNAGSRAGIPDEALWTCLNAQVIGPGQIQTLAGPADPIVSGLNPAAVSLWGVILNLSGVQSTRIIAIRADGSATAVDPGSGATTAICGAGGLSSLARVAVWRDTHVLFADPTTGFCSWDGTTFVDYPATFTADTTSGNPVIVRTGGLAATAIVPGMSVSGTGIPVGTTVVAVNGNDVTLSANASATNSGVTVTIGTGAPLTPRDIAVFEGRVWLVTASRAFAFSGPGSFTTFETAYAGGVAIITDPVFAGQITTIRAAMQLLWVVGANAINTVSNVQVISGITTFQNENLVAGSGTPFADSVHPLFRTMVFLGPPGVYAILGAQPQKLSDALDDLFQSAGSVGSCPGGVFTLNNILVYSVLVTIGGVKRLLLYSRPTWSICQQNDNLVWVATIVRTSGVLELWGTDGAAIFQLFAGATGDYDVAFKHFDYGDFTRRKTVRRFAIEATVSGLGEPDLNVQMENERLSLPVTGASIPSVVTWVNEDTDPVTWQNAVAAPVTWVAAGRLVVTGAPEFSGNLISMRLVGADSVPLVIGAFAWEVGYSGDWVFEPTT